MYKYLFQKMYAIASNRVGKLSIKIIDNKYILFIVIKYKMLYNRELVFKFNNIRMFMS